MSDHHKSDHHQPDDHLGDRLIRHRLANTPPPTPEIETLAAWDEHIARAIADAERPAGSDPVQASAVTDDSGQVCISGWVIQSLDLTDRAEVLNKVNPNGAMFLGCTLPEGLIDQLRSRGALIFPKLPAVPFDPYRAFLYQPEQLYDELFRTQHYAATSDARIYRWFTSLPKPAPITATLAMALHDQSMEDALDEVCVGVDPKRTIGIMGGHAVERGQPEYAKAARLASRLGESGCTVVTGGGPGAMEAANLGAHLAGQPHVLQRALETLASTPHFAGKEKKWIASALEVRSSTTASGLSIGIPTWYYGHEPANVFATHIAKYFSNAVREDTLLHRCRGGLVYLPGAAGTVQEIFQAATANYYASDPDLICPMVFVGVKHWTVDLPAWPLIKALGEGRMMGDKLMLVDDVEQAAQSLVSAG